MLLAQRDRAEELVQDLFLWVWERCLAIDESTPSRAYLYRAAHNAVLNRLRRQRIEQRWREEQPDGSVQHLPPVGQSDVKNVSEFNNFYFTTGRTTMIGLRVRS